MGFYSRYKFKEWARRLGTKGVYNALLISPNITMPPGIVDA